MIFIFLILGAIIGVSLFDSEGLILGMAIGFLGHQTLVLRRQVNTLTNQVETLKDRIRQAAEAKLRTIYTATPKAVEVPKQDAATPEITPHQERVEPADAIEEEEIEDFELLPEESILQEAPPIELKEAVEQKQPEPAVPGETATRARGSYRDFSRRRNRQADIPELESVLAFFKGGNWLVRAGVAVLFIGFSFLVRLAIEYKLFPLELRLLAVGAAGAAMVFVGFRLAKKRPEYGITLQGGGIAVMYLTSFVSFRLYDLLADSTAMVLMMVITALGVVLALRQHAQWLSVVSMIGGFFVPVLIASEDGSHVMLFSYYAILNMGILAIAFYKDWRYLNLSGFLCTFGIGTVWGGLNYDPDYFATTEPFLILFFAVYLALSIVYALRYNHDFNRSMEGTLVFGLPVVVFTLQAGLVQQFEYGLAISSFLIGGCYVALAQFLRLNFRDTMGTMIQAFMGIGIALMSMTIPFSLNATWTGIGWALEGAALVWLGIRQQRRLVRLGGYLLAFIASLSFVGGYLDHLDAAAESTDLFLLNPMFAGCLVMCLALGFIAYQMNLNRHQLFGSEGEFGIVALLVSVAFWLVAGTNEVQRVFASPAEIHMLIGLFGLSACVFALLGHRLQWAALVRTSLVNVPALYYLLFNGLFYGHTFEEGGWIAWSLVIPASYLSLYVLDNYLPGSILRFAHAAYLWLVTILVVDQVSRFFPEQPDVQVLLTLITLFGIVYLVSRYSKGAAWPFAKHPEAYLKTALMPLLLIILGVVLYASLDANHNGPLFYLPLINLLDITLAFGFMVIIYWYNSFSEYISPSVESEWRPWLKWGLVVLIFFCFNATIARTIHHWVGVPYTPAMFESSVFQTSLSICWTIIAVLTMGVAARRGLRVTWLVAAGLLGIVILKLFTVDLSSLTTIHRIISFMVVGLLLLIIGYIAPVPPKMEREELSAPA